ncbi:hypothetical protein EB822_05230 [Flavobacteriaceae bacterium PRS1]|nr:hypothetical protein EB822_05230 [Flavobacteriaceae bacterium PRS1]
MQQFYTVTFATILKNKIIKYTIDESESKLNEIIRDEIKRNTLDKKYNLSGEDSIFGGYDIYKHIPFGYSVPLKTPLIKLNLKFVSSVRGNIKNILRLKRVNGEAYDIHRAIAIVLVTILTIVSSYQILIHGFTENTSLSIMPVFGIGYFLIVEIIARIIFKNLCKKVEKIMNTEGIVYTKL